MKYLSIILTLLSSSICFAHRDLETGTFLPRDLIGYSDGQSVYCYVNCNPIYPVYEAYETRPVEWSDNSTGNPDPQRANTKDEEAELGLLNEGMRYRDLEAGTFLTRDPIGYADGPNVYCYVHCNPITSFDPLGLLSESQALEEARSYHKNEYDGDKSFDDWYNQDDWYGQLAADGYTIYSDDFSEVLVESSAKNARKSAFIVQGVEYSGKYDTMFIDGSQGEISDLRSRGYDVNIYDVSRSESLYSATVAQSGFSNIRNLDVISIYAHMALSINLNAGEGLWSEKDTRSNPDDQMLISDISVGHATKNLKVSLYGCNVDFGSTYQQEMANALNRPITGVPAGYSCMFYSGRPVAQRTKNKFWPFRVDFKTTRPEESRSGSIITDSLPSSPY